MYHIVRIVPNLKRIHEYRNSGSLCYVLTISTYLSHRAFRSRPGILLGYLCITLLFADLFVISQMLHPFHENLDSAFDMAYDMAFDMALKCMATMIQPELCYGATRQRRQGAALAPFAAGVERSRGNCLGNFGL